MGAIKIAVIIRLRLKSTGVYAGIENFLCVFCIPPAKATKDIRAR